MGFWRRVFTFVLLLACVAGCGDDVSYGLTVGGHPPAPSTTAPLQNPLEILGSSRLRVWYCADDVTVADQDFIPTLTDRSGNGNGATGFVVGQGARLNTNDWLGKPVVRQFNWAFNITGSSAVNVFNGSTKPFTVIMVKQDFSVTAKYNWSVGATVATNQYIASLSSSGKQIIVANSGGGNAQDTLPDDITIATKIEIWSRAADGTMTVRRDGIVEASFDVSTAGLTVDRIQIGGSGNGSAAVAASDQGFRHFLIVEGVLTADETTKIEAYLATENGLTWKKGLGGNWTGNTYVVFGNGQSNLVGVGSPPYVAVSGTRYLAYDRHLNLRILADPVSAQLGLYTSFFYIPWVVSTQAAGGSLWPGFVNDLEAHGFLPSPNDRVIVVDCSSGGSSADAWRLQATISPPPVNRFLGAVKLQLQDVMRSAPHPVLLAGVVYQGESEGNNATEAAEWGTVNWGPILDQLNTYASSKGWTWYGSTKRYVVVQLPSTAYEPTPGNPVAFWGTVRTSQANLVLARTDSTLVAATNGPWTDVTMIHLETAPLNTTGTAVGAAVRAF